MNNPPASLTEMKSPPNILCLSHLRWNWVFQRPQHLLTRAAESCQVFVFEEPLYSHLPVPRLVLSYPHPNVTVATPHLREDQDDIAREASLRTLLDHLIEGKGMGEYVLWYYTPMALSFSRHLSPAAIIYDCMDELSAFAGAPPHLADLERELLSRCDAVFTGGPSLFEVKRPLHAQVYCFPSSVDVAHFASARKWIRQPEDQADLPRPRLGYFGVIDERLDLQLIEALAKARPMWQIVLIGPVTKIEERTLPRAANIHYLGAKRYQDLPAYVAGWDVALMPFARNDSTRFLSPTKTPEYLAAGKPVVSTSIRDVVRMYGAPGYVRIADSAQHFIEAVEMSLHEDPVERVTKVDALLGQQSWDMTWSQMQFIVDGAINRDGARSSCMTI